MTTRAASDGERSALQAALRDSRQSRSQRLRLLPGLSFSLLLPLGLLWCILYWVGWKFFSLDLGLHGAAAPWIAGVAVLALVAMVGPEVSKTLRHSRSAIRALEADLASGSVEDMTIRITDAMRFQEPEHGGFLYFLRTGDERVYVQFDYGSQDRGRSRYLPRDTLNVVRGQHGGHILASVFTGHPVEIAHDGKLTAKPGQWPEPDTFCSTPWNMLVSTYAAERDV
jgi:hypothetical protein